jgi:DNA-binding XRE family transcriptional regulator
MVEVQIIRTGGEDLVVLPRRRYEALLARAGDPLAGEAPADAAAPQTAAAAALPPKVLERITAGENTILVLREFRGLSQAELARRADLAQPFVSKLERSVAGGSLRTMRALASALDAPLDLMLGQARAKVHAAFERRVSEAVAQGARSCGL